MPGKTGRVWSMEKQESKGQPRIRFFRRVLRLIPDDVDAKPGRCLRHDLRPLLNTRSKGQPQIRFFRRVLRLIPDDIDAKPGRCLRHDLRAPRLPVRRGSPDGPVV